MLVFLARPQRRPAAADPLRELQAAAERTGHAAWGHWGDQPERYAAWSNHSNRLIPVYTFGMSLESVAGARSIYRDPSQLAQLYGRLPETTLNPDTRRMLPVRVDDAALEQDLEVFNMMMARENASQRREWMEEYGNLVDADIS